MQKKEKAFSSTAAVIATAYHRFPPPPPPLPQSFHQIDRLYKMSDRPKRFKLGPKR